VSIEAMVLALHHSNAKGTTKLVLLGIANHDGDGGAWPSVGTLAIYANVDARTVRRSIRELVAAGELRVSIQGGGVVGMADYARPNRYEVLVRCPEGCDGSTKHRVTPTSGGDADVTPPPDAHVTPRGTPTSAKPSYEPSTEPSGSESTSSMDSDSRGKPREAARIPDQRSKRDDWRAIDAERFQEVLTRVDPGYPDEPDEQAWIYDNWRWHYDWPGITAEMYETEGRLGGYLGSTGIAHGEDYPGAGWAPIPPDYRARRTKVS
jgi:hypothetical protein